MEYRFSNGLRDLKPSAIREIFKSLSDPQIIAFAAGNPAAESFPVKDLSRLSARLFETQAATALQYGTTEGYMPLRKAVESRLQERFGIDSEANELLIVSGGQQGIDLTAKALLNPGDTVIAESPSFIGGLNTFRSYAAKLVGVELTEKGICVEKLEAALKANPQAKLLYTIPTFHNPSGITTDLPTRKAVYELCKRYGVMILEDNPYGELRFAGEDVPTYKSMDTEGIVVYCGSFSKVLSAGMRVGFVSAPKGFVSKMTVAKQGQDVHTNLFFQMLCHAFMTQCDMDAHIDGIRALYRRKCALMLETMDRCFDSRVQYTRPDGGLFLWCTMPEGTDIDGFVKAALAKKVAVVPGVAFAPDPTVPSPCFRVTYATPTEEQIVRGTEILADTMKDFLK
ncbi:MAG: PLP-dependent aminotransferase family protein [Clostridia bacterium]|nr:PLP-dependent aminotransferase family protein [Clostridia bacterium]